MAIRKVRLQIGILLASLLGFFSLPALAVNIPLTISVDWEGRSLDANNLQAMRNFRRDFPEIKIVHFLNAAYFTQTNANADEVREKIASVLRPGDELGLHIHGWKQLFEAAGVPFRTGPTFWGRPLVIPQDGSDVGHDVMISAYSVEELRRVIRYSVQKLNENGFEDIKSFRAGGWIGAPNVLEALVREGFTADSSATPNRHLREKLGQLPLYTEVGNLWENITIHSQPFTVQTPAGPITEFPNNAGLADYVTARQIYEIFREQRRAGTALYIHYGFHQETAARFLGEVRSAISLLRGLRPFFNNRIESRNLDTSLFQIRPACINSL